MSQDDLTSRLDSFETALADIRSLLTIAYNGTGAINAQVASNAQALETLRRTASAIDGRLSDIEERLRRLEASSAQASKIAKAVAKTLLAPEELAALGFIPELPFASQA